MIKFNLLFKRVIGIFLLVTCFFVFAGCQDKTENKNVSISLTATADTIKLGETIIFDVVVTGSSDTSFTWDVSHPDVLSIDINYNATLKASVTSDLEITVKVTANADTTKSATKIITAKPTAVTPGPVTPPADVVVGIEGLSEIKSGKTLELNAVVSGIDDQAVTWEVVEGSDYVSINDSGVLTAIDVETDHNVKVKATSVVDPTKSATKNITLVGKPVLTQAMLDEVAEDKIAFDGYIQIDLYTSGIFENFYQTYNTPVKTAMDGTNWYAEYLNGDTGTNMQMYFKNHEDLACQVGVSLMNDEEFYPMLDDLGNEISWDDSGLYNNFIGLTVDDFEFNEEIWRYEYVGDDDSVINKMIASANPYDFDATGFSLIIEEGMILGIHSKANADYTIVAGYKAMQQLFLTINYGDMVDVPTVSKYSHEDIHDDLTEAIENMKNLNSYKLDYMEDSFTMGLSNGEMGFTETITETDCYFDPYTVVHQGERVKNYVDGDSYGYKKINDNLYNTYYEVPGGYTATRAYEKDFINARPTFAFAAEIFREYYIDETEGTITYWVDSIMSVVASTFYYGVGNDINLYGLFATSEDFLTGATYKPFVVVKDGYIIQSGFYYFVGSIYGVVEINYSDFNTATLPDGVEISFETRLVPVEWKELTIEVSEEGSSTTADDVTVNALDYLIEYFDNENIGEELPFFGKVLGDTYGFGLTTMYLPSGTNMMLPAIMFYYDVPLDIDYTINSSLEIVGQQLIDEGFTLNRNGWYQKGDMCVAPTDSSLDFIIYVWKSV